MQLKQQDSPAYVADMEDFTIKAALSILEKRMVKKDFLASPKEVIDYLKLKFAGLEYELFGVLFLDSQHRIITYKEMFRGTLTQTSVYPREVVKEALKYNAAAVVLSHNHPSGVVKPSNADEHLTQTLKAALALIDVRVIDHIVIAGADSASMAQLGLV